MQKKTVGNVVPLKLSKPAYPRVSKKQKERLTYQIENHPRLSLGQKEQALYFLLSPTYPRSGYAIAQNYIKLCLNPKYTARGAAWRDNESLSV